MAFCIKVKKLKGKIIILDNENNNFNINMLQWNGLDKEIEEDKICKIEINLKLNYINENIFNFSVVNIENHITKETRNFLNEFLK